MSKSSAVGRRSHVHSVTTMFSPASVAACSSASMAGVEEGMRITTRALKQEVAHVPFPKGFDFERDGFVTSDSDMPVRWMANTDLWGTTRFVEPEDLRHDMHVNIVTFKPGGRIPFAETHVMEHGLYVLEGTARYLLNTDWVEVGPGDFMWLRAFCPQACYAGGPGRFRYLLYKDVNRHAVLSRQLL